MAMMLLILFVAVLVVLAVGGYGVTMYNSLVSLQRRCEQSFKNIDVLEKQRNDELTKLIDAVSGIMDHEEDVLTELTKAREMAEQAETPSEHAEADEKVRGAMMNLNARAEDYPELRSSDNMMQLQDRISEIENQIADRREFYNEAATRNNTRISQFPYVLMANQFGFGEHELFEATAEEKEDVDVSKAFA